jgi:hypothetical protein
MMMSPAKESVVACFSSHDNRSGWHHGRSDGVRPGLFADRELLMMNTEFSPDGKF